MSNPCDVKKFYDTEYEATIIAAKATGALGAEMYPYKCGTHWHIANKDPNLRSKHRQYNKMYCEVCKCYLKRGHWDRHRRTYSHINKIRKLKANRSGLV